MSKSKFRISEDKSEMDFKLIHQHIAQSYWGKGIPFDVMARAINNALCIAVFDSCNNLVGFGRVITDKATVAYVSDVFVVNECRQQGLGKLMVEYIINHPDLQGLRRMLLATADAHGLYQQFGFNALVSPDMFMEIFNPDAYA